MKFLLVTEHWVECPGGWPDAMKNLSAIENVIGSLPMGAELNQSYAENDETGDRRDAEGDEV
jgi:hypothetical protein